MKWSIASTVLCGASVVFARSLPQPVAKRANALPLDTFGWFDTMSLEDAKAGKTQAHSAIHEVMEDIEDALGFNTTDVDSDAVDTNSAAVDNILAATDAVEKVTIQAECTNPNVRYEWRDYSDTDRRAFVDGIKCLLAAPASGSFAPATNRWEDLVRVHQMMTSTIHGNNIFLLWHRYYTWTFEQILRDECGFDRAFPWWDETLDAGNFAASTIFTADFFGSLPQATNGAGTCITDGAFAGTTCHIGPGTGSQDHCLSRAVDESLTAQSSSDFVNTCNSRTTYADMENCAELGPHAYGHNGIGSVMADVSASPSDPIFFLHHLFVDRNYWTWQNADETRKSTIDGCIDANNPCTALTLDTVISVQGLRPDVTVRDVINPVNGAMCYTYTY